MAFWMADQPQDGDGQVAQADYPGINLDHTAHVGDGRLGKRRLPEEVTTERLPVSVQGRAGVRPFPADQVFGQPGCAVRRVPVAAVGARSAGCERQDGVVTRLDGRDGSADLLDDPSAFVAENSGQRERQSAAGRDEAARSRTKASLAEDQGPGLNRAAGRYASDPPSLRSGRSRLSTRRR
jgi:hypothetical protein